MRIRYTIDILHKKTAHRLLCLTSKHSGQLMLILKNSVNSPNNEFRTLRMLRQKQSTNFDAD
jgi:hypothetical protein